MKKQLSHVAFIMDGNRRWARVHNLPLMVGHKKGYDRVEPLIKHAQKLGIQTVTFWAFSTDNWNREKEEVDYLMSLFRDLFKSPMLSRIKEEGGRVVVLGEITPFPKDLQTSMKKIVEETADNTKMTVNIALNYGGREEILHAVNNILKDNPKDVDAKTFDKYLYTHSQKDPDLIIRTGGEQRLSGFLPWQAVYSELYFTEKYWPEFGTKEFDKAIKEYENRDRRFGK